MHYYCYFYYVPGTPGIPQKVRKQFPYLNSWWDDEIILKIQKKLKLNLQNVRKINIWIYISWYNHAMEIKNAAILRMSGVLIKLGSITTKNL